MDQDPYRLSHRHRACLPAVALGLLRCIVGFVRVPPTRICRLFSGNVPYQLLALILRVPDCQAYPPPLKGFSGETVVHQYGRAPGG